MKAIRHTHQAIKLLYNLEACLSFDIFSLSVLLCSSLYFFQVGELVPKAPTVLKPSLKDEHLVKYILSPSASSACSVWVKRQYHDKLLGKRVSLFRHAWFFTSFLLRMFNTVRASVFKFLRHFFGFNFFHTSRFTTGINLNKLRWHRTLIEMTYF